MKLLTVHVTWVIITPKYGAVIRRTYHSSKLEWKKCIFDQFELCIISCDDLKPTRKFKFDV